MTVSTTTSRADYNGNGATTAFTVPFYFLDSTHLVVLRTQISTGFVATMVSGTDYTVSGAGVPAGGTVTFTVAPTDDQKVSILRNVPLTQLTAYVPNDPFPAASHERALDKLTMEMQQVNEVAGRSLRLPANTSSDSVSVTLPTPAANQVVGWNSTATALTNFSTSDLATSVVGTNQFVDAFSGDNTTVTFALSSSPQSKNNTAVYISGVYQAKSRYTITGNMITFLTAPPTGTNNIEVVQQVAVTYPVSAISPNTVNTAQIVDYAVTTPKIADGNINTAKIADASVTTAKIADNNVTTAKIVDGGVTTAKIADGNVTSAKIADGSITTAKLASGQQMTTTNVLTATASAAAGAVGTYGAVSNTTAYTPGTTYSGASIGFGSGTWRCMTCVNSGPLYLFYQTGDFNSFNASLFLRIS